MTKSGILQHHGVLWFHHALGKIRLNLQDHATIKIAHIVQNLQCYNVYPTLEMEH